MSLQRHNLSPRAVRKRRPPFAARRNSGARTHVSCEEDHPDRYNAPRLVVGRVAHLAAADAIPKARLLGRRPVSFVQLPSMTGGGGGGGGGRDWREQGKGNPEFSAASDPELCFSTKYTTLVETEGRGRGRGRSSNAPPSTTGTRRANARQGGGPRTPRPWVRTRDRVGKTA